MKLYTRIIAAFVAVVITFSVCAAPRAEAALVDDVVVSYSQSSLAQWTLATALSTGGEILFGPIGLVAGGAIAAGINDLASWYAAGYTDQDLYDSENDYISTLDRTLISSDKSVIYRCSAGRSSGVVYYTLSDGKMVETSDTTTAVCAIDWNYGPEKVEYTLVPLTSFYYTSFAHIYCRMPDLVADGTYAAFFPDIRWAIDATMDGCSLRLFQYAGDGVFTYYYHSTPSRYSVVGSADINSHSGELLEVWNYPYSGNLSVSVDYVYSGYLYYPILVSQTLVSPPDNPDPITRPSSLSQVIHNYNTDNSYSNSTNYYLVSLHEEPSAETLVSPVIYDEETLVFTESATGAQYLTTGWVYDYATRSYDITLEPDTFVLEDRSVTRILCTYGDESVQLVYYDADGSAIATDEYVYVIATSESTGTDPEQPGSGGSSSSGDTIWDKLGNLLGTTGTGILDLIGSVFGKLLDGITALLEMIFEKLGRVVEILLSLFDKIPLLFGGYLEMFGSVFAFIPEDIMTLLTFGVACLVVLGIWKLVRK